MAVPFFVIDAGRLLATALDVSSRRHRRWRFMVAAAALGYLVYNGGVGLYERHRYLSTGIGVDGVESTDRISRWQIGTVEAVARAIDAERIAVGASWWPGYFVSSKTAIAVDFANDFGLYVGAVLSPEERRHLHVVNDSQMAEMISRRQPRLYVEGNWANFPTASRMASSGYQLRATVENAKVWTVAVE